MGVEGVVENPTTCSDGLDRCCRGPVYGWVSGDSARGILTWIYIFRRADARLWLISEGGR